MEKDTLSGEAVTAKALESSGCRINEAALKIEPVKPTLESRDLLSEHTHHVLYSIKNTKPVKSHVPLTQTNPNSDATVGITMLAPTWKRIPWEKKPEIHESLSPSTLKQVGSDIYDHELPKKKKSVSHDDWKTPIILVEAEVLPAKMNILCWNGTIVGLGTHSQSKSLAI